MNCKKCGWRLRSTDQYCKCCGSNSTGLVSKDERSKHLKNLILKYTCAVTTPLTEAEWLSICKESNGCAFCGTPHIEARVLVVGVKAGGSYNRLNVLPACGDCSITVVDKKGSAIGRAKVTRSYEEINRAADTLIRIWKKEFGDETFDAARVYAIRKALTGQKHLF